MKFLMFPKLLINVYKCLFWETCKKETNLIHVVCSRKSSYIFMGILAY